MDMLTPSTLYAAAVDLLPACDIDHHCSDLYIRVTKASAQLRNRYQYPRQVTIFTDAIEGVLWYEFPFCYPEQRGEI